MKMFSSVAAIAVLAVMVVGCSSDPQEVARDHFEKGNAQFTKQKFPEALIEYRRATQADPRLGPARLQLAITYASVGDGPNALREYARAAELMPEDEGAQLKAGNFMLLAGLYQDAQTIGTRLLERNPKSAEAQILVANALAGMKDMEGAVGAFERALTMEPNRAGTYAELGSVHLIRGDAQAAEAAFRKAIEIAPNSANAHIALGNFLWAKGSLEPAVASIRTALGIEPENLVGNRAMAMYYLLTNKRPEAEPHLKIVAKRSPGADATYFLAEYYVRSNRPDEARAVLQPLMSNEAHFVGTSVRLARLEVLAGKNADAHRLLEAALAREPNHAETLVTLGKLQLAEGNTVNALTTLQKAVAANPRAIDAHIGLAQVYAARGAVKEATTSFNDALSVDGNSVEARIGLARVHLESGAAGESVPLLLKVVEQQPGNAQARILLLHGLMAVGDLPQATRQLKVLRTNFPDSPTVNTAAGQLAMLQKDVEGARQAYGRALAADPRSYQALAGLLNTEMQSKNLGRARELIDQQLAKMPNDPGVLMMAAQTYDVLGDAFEMERALKKTVEADPQSLQAYTMLGRMYYQQGRLDLARQELEKYVATAPMSVPGNTMLGTILELQGKNTDAKQRYQKALQIDPRAAVAANNLAWIDANSDGNLDMALQLAQAAKAQLPNRHEVDDTLGFVYYRKGLSSQAIEALTASTQKQPDNPTYNYHLALAHHQSGNMAAAKKHLEKALQSKSTFSGAAEARKLLDSLASSH